MISVYSIIHDNIRSIYNPLSILIIMLIVLSISSLLTVIERKGLASSQRRLGPSINGWFGLIQIVQDGIKLILKDYKMGEYVTNSKRMYLIISCILNFVFSYLLFLFLYLDYVLYTNISLLFGLCIVIIMMNHITIIICGLIINNSKWTLLSCIRTILLYFMYDILLILIFVLLCPLTNLSFSYTNNFINLNQFIESQYYTIHLIKYPLLFVVYLFAISIEAGRIPFDLLEAESELISGYTIEYSGFLPDNSISLDAYIDSL